MLHEKIVLEKNTHMCVSALYYTVMCFAIYVACMFKRSRDFALKA